MRRALWPDDAADSHAREVERFFAGQLRMPLEVLQEIQTRYSQYTLGQLVLWVERFFQLWCRNQWKRERYAPSFHLDDENLDPKTWCRFPILSGGFERELKEFEAYVARITSQSGQASR
jgi:NAD+ synthase (glutamine-hydrolysing)